MADRFPDLEISFSAGDADSRYCTSYADMLYDKFTAPHPRDPDLGAYENGASILILPDSYDEYWEGASQMVRRKVRKALKTGYEFAEIDRETYRDDIFEINTSMEERQGRPMTEAYRSRPKPFSPLPNFSCPRHRLYTLGVLYEGRLVAYTWIYQVGEMCLFSTILGHGDHLDAGVMFLLIAESLRLVIERSQTRFAMYNMHYSGTEGLRFFKERMGFQAYRVQWRRTDADRVAVGAGARSDEAP